MATESMVKLQHAERHRIYHYADGTKQMFDDVVEIGVTKSGFHKLTTGDRSKFIVAPGWRHISLDVDDWTF